MLLNGAWQGTVTNEKGETFAFPATVPGCVHTDLLACGKIGDFYYRDESKTVQWIERCDATFTRDFDVAELLPGAELQFDGLDTYCEILLNGTTVGEGHNMFVPHTFPVDGVLKRGTNRLEVRFRSPVREVEGKPALPGAVTVQADAFTPFAIVDRPELLLENALCMKKGETRVLRRLRYN